MISFLKKPMKYDKKWRYVVRFMRKEEIFEH
jgi:hypothetical protein